MIISVGGRQVTGFSDTDLVTITRDEQKFTKIAGADGEIGRSHNCSDAGTITFSLMQTSEANDYFSQLLLNDAASIDGSDMVSVYISDELGTSKYLAEESWFQNPAEAGFANEIGTREWILDCAKISHFNGGNRTNSTSLINGAIGSAIEAVIDAL